MSPDEGPVGGERFVWSRDGRHGLLLGPYFYARPASCLASGEWLSLHLDTLTRQVRNNATQTHGSSFTLTELAGIEFGEDLAPGQPGGSKGCERSLGALRLQR